MFFNENLLFCNLIEAFFSSLKLNFMHDGIVLCLSHLFASLKLSQLRHQKIQYLQAEGFLENRPRSHPVSINIELKQPQKQQQWKHHLKSEFMLFKNSPLLLHLINLPNVFDFL